MRTGKEEEFLLPIVDVGGKIVFDYPDCLLGLLQALNSPLHASTYHLHMTSPASTSYRFSPSVLSARSLASCTGYSFSRAAPLTHCSLVSVFIPCLMMFFFYFLCLFIFQMLHLCVHCPPFFASIAKAFALFLFLR